MAPIICDIVNLSLKNGIFPTEFKKAIVCPLIKKSTLDKNILKNNRPVSNLSFISKITEKIVWGTGMIASSSTFRPHSGRVIRDLFRLLDAVTALYGSTSLQQSSKGSCSLLVSGYNLRADCQWRTLAPPLNSGANAAPASVLALM